MTRGPISRGPISRGPIAHGPISCALVLVVAAACASSTPALPTINSPVAGKVAQAERFELATAIAIDDGLVAVTRAGNIVRYDRELRYAVDAIAPSPVVAIANANTNANANAHAHGGDTLYAALADRSIVKIDPATLRFEPALAKAAGDVLWIGVRANEVLVFVQNDEPERRLAVQIVAPGETTRTIDVPYEWVETKMKGRPNAFLLDGDTLWWGIDAGEWGGVVGRMDLETGIAQKFDTGPIYGFVKHAARVMHYGGLAHLGSAHGTIGVVENEQERDLWHRASTARHRTKNPPGVPIAHMISAGDRLYALVWRELYEVSADLQRWTKLATLPVRARPGRPDAMSSYPATVAMRALGDARGVSSGAIVFATTQDGLFVWRAGRLARVAP